MPHVLSSIQEIDSPLSIPHREKNSVSEKMFERFEHRKTWRRVVSVIYAVSLLGYLSWRVTIINPDSLLLSLAYFAAECIGFILGITAIITSWDYRHRKPLPAPIGVSVDVFVPTYKEPLSIIRRTVMAARDISYSHNTFILDDGKRPEVEALAEELGISYLRRPDNKNAKAGNLNYGLTHSSADFVMVFDADHIPLPHSLDVTLGFFSDDNVAMVQTPQDYYNIDAFQYMNSKRSGGLWHDQSYFYNIVQPNGDAANAVSCVGTGVIYRRSALDEIGGIPTETVTEDIHTSLKLHKKGYRAIFLNETIAYGIASSDLTEYYKTRHRWGHGNLHALKLEKILTCKGLTLRQRFQYLALGLIYLEGWQQLLMFIIPMVALIAGWQPFQITIFNILIVLCFPIVSYVMLQEIGCGFTRYWTNELYSMARWPIYLISSAGLFGAKMRFNSSAKNIRGSISWQLMLPQILVLIGSLTAAAIGIIRLSSNFTSGPLFAFFLHLFSSGTASAMPDVYAPMPQGYTFDLVAIAGFWALYSAIRAVFFIRKVFHDAKASHNFFRFRIPFAATINGEDCIIHQLSEDWLSCTLYNTNTSHLPNDTFTITIYLPAGPLSMNVRCTFISGTTFHGDINWTTASQQDTLASALYSVDWHREFLHRTAYFLTPSDLLLSVFGMRASTTGKFNAWSPILFDGSSSMQSYGIIGKKKSEKNTFSLICFETFEKGDILKSQLYTDDGITTTTYTIVNSEALSSLVHKGLDEKTPLRYLAK